MNYDNFTTLAEKALKYASQLAKSQKHKTIENGHILKGILNFDKNITPFLLKKAGIDHKIIEEKTGKLIQSYTPLTSGNKLSIAAFVDKTLEKASVFSSEIDDEFISVEHLLAGILLSGDGTSALLKNSGLSLELLRESILELRRGEYQLDISKEFNTLNNFATNVTAQIDSANLKVFAGRGDIIKKILQLISLSSPKNILIKGFPGVGKSAMAYGIAQEMFSGKVPESIRKKFLFNLNLSKLYESVNEPEKLYLSFKQLLTEVENSNGQIILFIDDIHLLNEKDDTTKHNLFNMFKASLLKRKSHIIATISQNKYPYFIKSDSILDKLFETILLEEPDKETTIEMIQSQRETLEIDHKVSINPEAIQTAVEYSSFLDTPKYLPGKAIDLMDEAATRLQFEINSLPEEITKIEKMIKQLKVDKETAVIKKDKNQHKNIEHKIAQLSDERSQLRALWESEKDLINQIMLNRENIAKNKNEIVIAEKKEDFKLIAKLKLIISNLTKENKQLNAQLHNKQQNTTLFRDQIDSNFILELIAEKKNISLTQLQENKNDKYLAIERFLGNKVIGQKQAIKDVANAIRRNKTVRTNGTNPLASCIFAGSPGTGKTKLAKELALYLFWEQEHLLYFDMADFSSQQGITDFLGEDVENLSSGSLLSALHKKPNSVILLTNFEKANPTILKHLAMLFSNGKMHHSDKNHFDFSETIFILTTTAGSEKLIEYLNKLQSKGQKPNPVYIKNQIVNFLKSQTSEQLITSVDAFSLFNPLNLDDILQIISIKFDEIKEKLGEKAYQIELSPNAFNWLAHKAYSLKYGAANVDNIIEKYIVNKVANCLLEERLQPGEVLFVDVENNTINLKNMDATLIQKIKQQQLESQKKETPHQQEKIEENKEMPRDGFIKTSGKFFKNFLKK